MILPLVLLFIVVPIAELAVIIQVGEAIGVWWTIALLIADSLLGSLLMRHQGRAAWRRFTESVGSGRVPAREVLDGALVMAGGALQLAPGFVTDGFGLLLLAPPTRAFVRRAIVRRVARHGAVRLGAWAAGRRPSQGGPARTPGDSGYDVEGTAYEDDERRRLP